MQINNKLTGIITSLAYGGEGITKHNGITGLVRGALPGELIKFRIAEIKKNYFRAETIEIIEPSPYRVLPPCPVFNKCGGCVYQHLAYDNQIKEKTSQLRELLKHIADIPEEISPKIIQSPQSFNYRNQITVKINSSKLGFTGMDGKSFIPIEYCLLAKEAINKEIPKIRSFIEKANKIKKVEGDIIIKCGGNDTIDFAFSESISPSGNYKLLQEKIENKIFYFSLGTFFQVNPYILPFVLSQLKDLLHISPNTALFDLYCGTGLFSIYLSPYIKNAYGIELNPGSVKLAARSAEINKIKNCRFYSGDASALLQKIYEKDTCNKKICILDPPRHGLSKDMIKMISGLAFEQLVYISCEPSVLARDLKLLYRGNCRITEVIVADMFPQTKHMETIVIMTQ